MKKHGILVNTKVLAKLSNYDKSFVEAYLFAKSLTQFVKHPILFNFNANRDAYRLKLGMGRYKYYRLLKSAIRQGFAVYHGNNLHLIGHKRERQLFGVKSNTQTAIEPSDLYNFARAQIIIKNIKSQQRALAKPRGSRESFARGPIDGLTSYPVLSCRKAGDLLNVSHTTALRLLTKLKRFGLTVHKNTVEISKETYDQLKRSNSYNARYNNGKHFYLGANRVEYKKVVVSNYTVKGGYSYCGNDI